MNGLREIPFGVDFLQEVATHIASYPAEVRMKLRVLLPHRRACRRLRALLIAQQSTAQVLPRIFPLGEPDVAEFALGANGNMLLPEIPRQTRWLLLAWLLRKARQVDGTLGTPAQDSQLAQSLGAVIDRLGEFDRDLSDLTSPEHEDFADHWQRLSQVLAVVQDFWPSWCEENQCLDPIARRNRVLRLLAESIRDDPVIIAGSSGRAVAVQYLMHAVLRSPNGRVYLQGTEIIDGADLLKTPTHPAFALARLYTTLKIQPNIQAVSAGTAFYRAAFRTLKHSRETMLEGLPKHIQALVLPDRSREIATTALLAREALARDPDVQVAVICQDNGFIDGLERWLSRWNMAIDRVAGIPALRSAEGRLARLMMDIWCAGLDVVRLLALLKHPLVCMGVTRAEMAQRTARIEYLLCEGYDGQTVAALFARSEEEAFSWLKTIDIFYEKLQKQNFTEFCTLWRETFFMLCRDADSALPNSRAWDVVQGWWQELFHSAVHIPPEPLTIDEFAGLVLPMFEGLRVPPPPRQQASVSVLSAMEARLMRFDRVVIPMMNYGVIPASPAPEPWMTRQHYQDCAMPAPEETVGLAAHDFLELCHQPEVFLLRAEKIGDEVVAASSWWDRLDTVHRVATGESMVSDTQNCLWMGRLHALLVADDNPSRGRPSPNPPLESRPKSLRVTDVNSMFLNPYDLYVRTVLRLTDYPVRKSQTYHLRRGIMMHKLMHDFVLQQPDNSLNWLASHTNKLLKKQGFSDIDTMQLRFDVARMATGIIAQERFFAQQQSHLEVPAEWQVAGMQIRGQADRLSIAADGVWVIDYKTGAVPADKKIRERYEWQLLLLALMVQQGVFGTPTKIQDLGYWRIGGSKVDGLYWRLEKVIKDIDSKEFFAEIFARFSARIQGFVSDDAAFSALPDPDRQPSYVAYPHLIRAEEWLEQIIDGGDEGDDDDD